VGIFSGKVGALKALVDGGLRQMSVPVGEERLKGGIWVVVVFVIVAVARLDRRRLREVLRCIMFERFKERWMYLCIQAS